MDYTELLKMAKNAAKNAYIPYSNFPVGACVLCESGKIYCGCNVENASYGLSICAERNAITSAVADGSQDIKAIAIYCEKMQKCTPCGACRQFINEFKKEKDIDIIVQDNNTYKIYTINQLLPEGFKL